MNEIPPFFILIFYAYTFYFADNSPQNHESLLA